MPLPTDHPQRFVLANEVHARPYEALEVPTRASYAALLAPAETRRAEHETVRALCERYGAHPPPADASHFSVDFGPFRLRWERHTEFSSYTFIAPGAGGAPFAAPAAGLVPQDWLARLPGEVVFAAHAEVRADARGDGPPEPLAAHFGGNDLIGSDAAGGGARVITDFRVHGDGFGRFLVLSRGLGLRQAGRLLQRLFEIEAYRMMALLALPLARSLAPRLSEMEARLSALAGEIARQRPAEEPRLLEELTHLAAELERDIASGQARFGAADAYYGLVRARIEELREVRIAGVQTIGEFMARRLAPAMSTCVTVRRRQLDLSERVARASSLLSTRVDIVRQRQNQELLGSMERRARLQLRLQETVEGLSVAAITYYLVGLVLYGAKALKASGVAVDPDLAAGVSIPVIALIVALGVRYVRRAIVRGHRAERAAKPR